MKRKHSTSSAHAMLELAIVLPVITMIGFAFLELSIVFSVYQRLGTISREVANIVSRECITLENYCTNNIDLHASTILPGSEIIVSVYEYDVATSTISQKAVYPTSGTTGLGESSRYSFSRVGTEIQALNSKNTLIVISEVFFTRTPITIIPITSGDYYEATIF